MEKRQSSNSHMGTLGVRERKLEGRKRKSMETKKIFLSLFLTGLFIGGLFGVFAQDTISGTSTSAAPAFSVSLVPGKVYSTSGNAQYKILITDLRPVCPLGGDRPCPEPSKDSLLQYKLRFEGIDTSVGIIAKRISNIKGNFSENGFFLGPGEQKEVLLKVRSGEIGDTKFAVNVYSENGREVTVNGDVVVSKISLNPVPEISFSGEGYARLLSNSSLTDQGVLVSVKFASKDDGTIKGLMNFDNEPYTIEGTYEGQDKIQFDLNGRAMNIMGPHFEGTIEKFNGFSLLSGELIFGERVWHVELTSGDPKYVRNINVSVSGPAKIISGVHMNEVISFNDESSDKNSSSASVYVQPVRIEMSKILWFIPNPFGKKVLVANFINGNSVSEIKISAGESKEINGYLLSVDSLSNEENLKIGVSKV